MTASHVSWTTSSAEASVETKVRASSSMERDQSFSSCAKVASSPARRPATILSSGSDVTTSGAYRLSSVLRVVEVEAAPGVPGGALVSVRRDATGVLEHARSVHQVPGHE